MESLEQLVAGVRAARKYRGITPEVIRTIARIELSRRKNPSEALKATKRRLHQVAGAYVPAGLPVERWMRALGEAGPLDLPDVCRAVMGWHASTRERLPFLEEFYGVLLGDCGPIRSVVDLGCGLNPLALPWMPVAKDCTYHAYDIYEDLAEFLGAFFARLGIKGHSMARDILHCPFEEETDVALLLKLLPCLARLDREAGAHLLDGVRARCILVSFPVHSLGGRRDKGMRENYEDGFLRVLESRGMRAERVVFPTELVFRIRTDC